MCKSLPLLNSCLCTTTVILLFCVIVSGSDAAANILLNPGFELGTGADAVDWEEFGGPSGTTTRSDAMPNTGAFSMFMQADHVNNPPAAVPYFVQQVQPVGSIDNTLNYDLSFSAKVDSLNFDGIDMFYQLQWLDQDASDGGGVKGETLVSLSGAGVNTSYQPFTLTDIDVPDGADSFLLRFQLSPGPIPDIANGLHIDDVSLSLNGVVQELAGDYNSDSRVSLLDYTLWRDNLDAPAGTLPNDTVGGPIAAAQFDLWKSNFGNTLLSGSLQSATAVPEPSTCGLVCLAALAGRIMPLRVGGRSE